jgi:hypothetical protein
VEEPSELALVQARPGALAGMTSILFQSTKPSNLQAMDERSASGQLRGKATQEAVEKPYDYVLHMQGLLHRYHGWGVNFCQLHFAIFSCL